MPDAKPKLSEIERRTEGATDGPWVRYDTDIGEEKGDVRTYVTGHRRHSVASTGIAADNYPGPAADATFIAASRTDVPALTAAIRAVLDVHRIRDESDRCCEGCETAGNWETCIAWPCPTYAALAAHLDLT